MSPKRAGFLERPGLLGAFLFAATMVVAAALAYQATQSARSHREAAASALRHHATIAAWRFARDARSWVGYGMGEAGTALNRIAAREQLPGPEILMQILAEKECDCMSAGFGRTFFRVLPGETPTITMHGEFLASRAADSLLLLSLDAASDTGRRAGPRQWLILPPGTPRLNRDNDVALLWKVGDPIRGVRAVYGMIVEYGQIERPLQGALGEAQFFPSSLVPDSVSRALVQLEVAGPNRARVFSSGSVRSEFAGTDTLGVQFGHMAVIATIDSSAAQMIAGGLPQSRSATIVALLVLALAMGAGALVLLRREYRLARLREDFVSGVSHELRTPLTQIRMLSELLASDGFRSSDERAHATGVIHREALRLSNLVDNVLAFSRLKRARAIQDATRFSLSALVREVTDALSPMLAAQNNHIEISDAEDISVAGDREAANRVLRNLIENAIKYGAAGQTIRIAVHDGRTGHGPRVTIDDEGPGIPSTERERIWQPYYRLDRDRNAPGGGSGLGLAVVADLMRQLGGSAFVSDAPEKGARFTLEFARAGEA